MALSGILVTPALDDALGQFLGHVVKTGGGRNLFDLLLQNSGGLCINLMVRSVFRMR